jgi:hypothetical protein
MYIWLFQSSVKTPSKMPISVLKVKLDWFNTSIIWNVLVKWIIVFIAEYQEFVFVYNQQTIAITFEVKYVLMI